jgi:hypothetical protein
MNPRSTLLTLTTVAGLALTTGCAALAGSADEVPLGAADPTTAPTPHQHHQGAAHRAAAPATPAAGSASTPAPSTPASSEEPTSAPESGASPSKPTLCQPDGPYGKTVRLVVPRGWTKHTSNQGCDWTAPDGMGSVSVVDVGAEQATFSAVARSERDAPGYITGYRKVALYGDRNPALGDVVVWEHLGEDVYTFHFATYYAVGWRTSLMLPEPSWNSTGAATFDEIRQEFSPVP